MSDLKAGDRVTIRRAGLTDTSDRTPPAIAVVVDLWKDAKGQVEYATCNYLGVQITFDTRDLARIEGDK